MRIGKRYREVLLALILLLGALPVQVSGTELQIKSDSLLRLFQRDTSSDNDASVMPGYEYLQVDAGHLQDYGLSFHLYGWGRNDFANNDYYDNQTAGELLYGYLEYRLEANRFNAKLGRFQTFEGVANDAVDGLRLSGDLGNYFSLSLYGGQPVALDSEQGRGGDSIYGGRLANHIGNHYEIGVSYKSIDNDHENTEEMFGIDLSVALPANLRLYGFSSYNDKKNDWAEHSYELRIPVGSVSITPFYQHFDYEGYFGTGVNAVNPFKWLSQTGEDLTAYGVNALWQLNESWTLGGKAKFFTYDKLDNAQTYSAQLAWQGDSMTQYGGEIGYTSADNTADNDYTLFRLFGYCDAMAGRIWVDFVSADLLMTFYKNDIYNEDNSLFVSLGTGKKFLNDALTFTLSGDYSQDPYFDDDLRGMVTMSYAYDKQ
jgi:hypothetical protein